MTSETRYETLYRIARALHHQNLDIQKTLQVVVALTGQALEVQHGCLVTFHEKNQTSIDYAYLIGVEEGAGLDKSFWNLLLSRGLVGFVRHGRRIINIRNISSDPRWPELPRTASIPRTGSAVGVPLHKGTYVYGVMLFIHSEVDYFSDERVELLQEIASLSSAAIGNALDFREVRARDSHYETLFEDAVSPIILTDLNGFIMDVNRKTCELLGYDRADLVRLPITRIHKLEAGVGLERTGRLDSDEEMAFRTTAVTATGTEVPVIVRARRLSMDGRDMLEWVEQDVTAQMELEQLRRDLSAMVYHDLRGPLQNIKGSIYKLGEVLANHDNRAVAMLLHIGMRSTRQLQHMVDSLLDLQRLEEGSQILNRQPMELRVVLADAVQLVMPLAFEAGQKLKLNVVDNIPLLQIDADMIMRVVINLMENATKYTPPQGEILVRATMEDGCVRVSVRDSGPGIPENMLRRVFDKFSRVKYKDAPKGVGLGLAFCRLAVEAHGGTIWVESDYGHGSEFIFTLPLEEAVTTASDDLALA